MKIRQNEIVWLNGSRQTLEDTVEWTGIALGAAGTIAFFVGGIVFLVPLFFWSLLAWLPLLTFMLFEKNHIWHSMNKAQRKLWWKYMELPEELKKEFILDIKTILTLNDEDITIVGAHITGLSRVYEENRTLAGKPQVMALMHNLEDVTARYESQNEELRKFI